MARKKRTEVAAELKQAQKTHLRYIIRNPNFHQDLEELNHAFHANLDGNPTKIAELRPRIAKTWGIPLNAVDLFVGNLQLFNDRTALEQFILEQPLSFKPIEVIENPKVYKTVDESRFVLLRMDLKYPKQELVELFEKELDGLLPLRPQSRRRLDRVAFYLNVFDLAEAGQTFGDIASSLNRRISTVKSAYLAASRHIFGPKLGPSKTALPLANFDANGHCQKCPTCQKAQTPEQFCRKAVLYANQDQRGRRERFGYDTVSERSHTVSTTEKGSVRRV